MIYTQNIYIPLLIFFYGVDFIADLVYVIDIIINLRTARIHNGQIESNFMNIFIYYSRTWMTLDILSIIPLDIIFLPLPWLHAVFRLNRILKAFKFGIYYDLWERYFPFPNAVKFAKLLNILAVIVHFVCCAYFALSYFIGFGVDDYTPEASLLEADLLTMYTRGFFWAVVTLSGFGDNRTPPGIILEYWFTSLVVIIGIFVFATIVSNVANVMKNVTEKQDSYRARVTAINSFLADRKVPLATQRRVRHYFDYLWSRQKGISDKEVLDVLPPNIRSEVSLFLNEVMIQKVPFFTSCSPGFINALVERLNGQIYSPDDCITVEGDLGNCMFFIVRGEVEVLVADKPVARLQEGSFFGEIALLYETKRTATVRAVTFCDVNILTRFDLQEILTLFPGHSDLILAEADTRLNRNAISRAVKNNSLLKGLSNAMRDMIISYITTKQLEDGDVCSLGDCFFVCVHSGALVVHSPTPNSDNSPDSVALVQEDDIICPKQNLVSHFEETAAQGILGREIASFDRDSACSGYSLVARDACVISLMKLRDMETVIRNFPAEADLVRNRMAYSYDVSTTPFSIMSQPSSTQRKASLTHQISHNQLPTSGRLKPVGPATFFRNEKSKTMQELRRRDSNLSSSLTHLSDESIPEDEELKVKTEEEISIQLQTTLDLVCKLNKERSDRLQRKQNQHRYATIN